jgi:DNA-binding XRE family transcriptional regulator
MKLNWEKVKQNTISLEEAFSDFTPEDHRKVNDLVRYYTVLMELTKLRKKLGLTQAKLAQKADLPRTTITKIESGTHNPTLNTLMRIASALGKELKITLT